MKQLAPIAAAFALTACVSAGAPYPPPPPPPVVWGNASATIGFGGQAILNDIAIRPTAVIEDSRCAINVRCVWAGRLVLAVEIEEPGDAPMLWINMTLGQPVAVAGGKLTLVAAHPLKVAGAQPSPPANRFKFELTR